MRLSSIRPMVLGAVLGLALASQATADWPERPIQLIVPFPAGSATDIVARIIAPGMGKHLGQPIVVENRAGASGAVGAQAVVSARPDGYTIGLGTTSTLAVAPALNPNLTYKPQIDFAPIGMISDAPYVLAVAPAVPATNVKSLIELAREKPDQLRYASAGPASLAHLAGALFATLADIKIKHIPYRTSAQSVLDLVASRVDIQFGALPPVLPHIQAGSLKVVAVTGAQRLPQLPNVPTLKESGFPAYEVSLWQALVAPARTPETVIAKLNEALNAALGMPDVAAALEAQSQTTYAGPPKQLAERVTTETQQWHKLGQQAGIVPE